MPGFDLLIAFFLTILILAITPGPGVLFIAAQTIGRGRKAGWFSAFGTHLASYVHILAAAFGLSLFLEAVPAAYLFVKFVGAAYLCFLGIRFFFADEVPQAPRPTPAMQSHLAAFKESIIVEVTNPKSAVFFLAFLPQFADSSAHYPLWLQIVLLGIIANIVFSLAELGIVFFADQVSSLVTRSKMAGLWMRRIAGTILIGLGLKLLLSER